MSNHIVWFNSCKQPIVRFDHRTRNKIDLALHESNRRPIVAADHIFASAEFQLA